nr:hypothetical protein [Tanacetum cinerariifolium]
MVWLVKCEELKEIFGTSDWVDMMVRYCQRAAAENHEFGRKNNLLREQVIVVFEERREFVEEIETVHKVIVVFEERREFVEEIKTVHKVITPQKTAQILNEDQVKFAKNLLQMLNLEKAMEHKAFEKDLFADKLLWNIPF